MAGTRELQGGDGRDKDGSRAPEPNLSNVLLVLFSGLQVDWVTLKASYTRAESLLFKPVIRKANLPLVLNSLRKD